MRSNEFLGRFTALALAGAMVMLAGSGAASARGGESDATDKVQMVTVTVDADEGETPRLEHADFAVYKGKNKLEIVGVKGPSEAPVNLAVLIQDGLDQGVGHELDTIRDFVKGLPEGSRVMVGYLRGTGLRVAEPFTADLKEAASSVRLPFSSLDEPSVPFIGLIEALERFEGVEGRNQVVMITNGLELNRDFASASPVNNIDLDRAISKAQRLGVPVWGIFANSAGRIGRHSTAIAYGQGSLKRLSDETGGKAFFSGRSFVTFDHALESIADGFRNQYLVAYRGGGKGDLEVTVEAPGVELRHSK
jgi:hypothetical protein